MGRLIWQDQGRASNFVILAPIVSISLLVMGKYVLSHEVEDDCCTLLDRSDRVMVGAELRSK